MPHMESKEKRHKTEKKFCKGLRKTESLKPNINIRSARRKTSTAIVDKDRGKLIVK
jgi:hypothetical protein